MTRSRAFPSPAKLVRRPFSRTSHPTRFTNLAGCVVVPKTQNARRILQYQRQIKHWLDDEEALLQQAPTPRTALSKKLAPTPLEGTPGPAGPPLATATPGPYGASASTVDALLSVENAMPPPLNPSELDALLSAPPLLYSASHAAPPAPGGGGPPPRRFCDNCGFWGDIKCLKCGARVCGLECKDAHEATRCLKWG